MSKFRKWEKKIMSKINTSIGHNGRPYMFMKNVM